MFEIIKLGELHEKGLADDIGGLIVLICNKPQTAENIQKSEG